MTTKHARMNANNAVGKLVSLISVSMFRPIQVFALRSLRGVLRNCDLVMTVSKPVAIRRVCTMYGVRSTEYGVNENGV